MKKIPTFLLVLTTAVSVSALDLKRSPLLSELTSARYGLDEVDFDDFEEEPKGIDSLQWEKPQKARGPKVSAYRAGLYSFLLPGLGQRANGSSGKARVFFMVEAASWIGFAGYRIYGDWKKNDLMDFAASAAGANLEGKDDEFLDLVGFYEDIDEYNTLGRVFDAADRPYLEDNADNHWRWQDSTGQAVYRNLKNRSREAHRRANFMLGLAVLNRIVSVIDAVREARRAERVIDEPFSDSERSRYRIALNPLGYNDQIRLTLLTGL